MPRINPDIILNHEAKKKKWVSCSCFVASVLRQHTHHGLQGEGVDLVVLTPVLFPRKILKIGQGVESANVGAMLWDYVVNLMTGRAVLVEILNLIKILPVYF